MTLKEIVANEEMQVILARGQEQGFLGIEEVAAALEGIDLVQEDAEGLYAHIDELGIELLEEPEAQERRAQLAEEAERPRRVAAKAESTTDLLQLFLRDIGRIPLLNAKQEVELAKLIEMIDVAAAPPAPPRRTTKPSRGAIERRLSSKKKDSDKKAGRRGDW